jgi:hypothetical protein
MAPGDWVTAKGVGQYSDWPYREIGEALALIMTTRPRSVPLGEAPLGGMVCTDPVTFAGWHGRHRFVIFVRKGYPSRTAVVMFNELLGAEYPVVITHSGRCRIPPKTGVLTV